MKILIRLALVLVVLLVLASVAVGFFADGAARSAIERGGTYALGVETTLDSADVGLVSGEFGLSGLAVDNPEGFGGEHFLELDEGSLALSYSDMSAEEVRVPELALTGVRVDLEKKGGETNYGTILENLERFQSAEPTEETEEQGGGGTRIVFERIVIRDVHAEVSLLPLGGSPMQVPVHVDEIVLEDVGSDGSGVTVSQVFEIVIHAVLTTVLTVGGDLIPDELLQDLGGQLTNLAGGALELTGDVTAVLGDVSMDLGAGLGDVLGDVGGTVGDAAGGLLEGVGDGLGGAVEGLGSGLGGILGGGDG